MKLITIEQGTEEWQQLRKGKLTATMYRDYLAVHKQIPNVFKISKNKLFMPIEPNAYMLAGTLHESTIRNNYNWLNDRDYIDYVALYDDIIMASLDGLDFNTNSLLEIKCTTKKLDEFFLADTIAFYSAQCEHQMQCSNADYCILHFASRLDLLDTLDINIKRGEKLIWEKNCNEILESNYFERVKNERTI